MEIENIREGGVIEEDRNANLELQRQYQDKEHGIRFSKHAYFIARAAMYVGGCVLIVLAIVWCLHIILPDCKRWLSVQEIQGIERILFSSIIITVAGKYFRKYKIIDSE